MNRKHWLSFISCVIFKEQVKSCFYDVLMDAGVVTRLCAALQNTYSPLEAVRKESEIVLYEVCT